MILGAQHYMRKIYCGIALTAFAASIPKISKAAEMPLCSETVEFHEMDWTALPVHKEKQSRDCHSHLSDALKAKANTNEMLSHAVYHQILAGESFRTIPLWPDKHEDWVSSYDGYYYTPVFWPALKAAKASWDEGFEGGVKHDFAVGWTQTVTETDFEINTRPLRYMAVKTYMALPTLLLIVLFFIEVLMDRFGWFPRCRLLHRVTGEFYGNRRR